MVGVIQTPYVGDWTDIALLPNGDLLGLYWRQYGTSAPIFHIDTQTAVATFLMDSQAPLMFTGIAIGPGTPMSTYCTAKTNSAGCLPAISALGFASVAGTSGFTVSAHDVLNQRWGGLRWTAAGPAALPFGGGTLCVASPFLRTLPSLSGGSPLPLVDCSGSWSLDMNTYLQRFVPFPPGTALHCQWLGRDPGFAPPQGLQLSDALTFTLKP